MKLLFHQHHSVHGFVKPGISVFLSFYCIWIVSVTSDRRAQTSNKQTVFLLCFPNHMLRRRNSLTSFAQDKQELDALHHNDKLCRNGTTRIQNDRKDRVGNSSVPKNILQHACSRKIFRLCDIPDKKKSTCFIGMVKNA